VTTLALLHTVGGLIPTFSALCQEVMPDVDTFNMVDESLLRNTIQAGQLTPLTTRRVLEHIASAEEAGADAVAGHLFVDRRCRRAGAQSGFDSGGASR